MKKRLISIVLTIVILFVTVVAPRTPLRQTARAAFPGEEVTTTLSDGSSYVYKEEPGFYTYDATDPQAMVLFSSSRVYNYASQDPDGDGVRNYWHFNGNSCSATAMTEGTGGSVDYKAQNNSINYADLDYFVRYLPGDFSTSGTPASDDQALVMNNWGVTRMVGFQMVDPTPGDEDFPGTGGDTTYDYYFNIQINLNKYVDLTKYTHIYFDFWVSGDYEIRTPGLLNFVLCDSAYSKNDGFEYNVDMSKLKLDGDNPRTGHTVQVDLRGWTKAFDNKMDISKINTVTFRYITPTSSKTQYNSGKTPLIWLGKIVAYTKTDNWHPGTVYYNADGSVNYSNNNNNPDPQQAQLMAVVGQQRWNTSTKILFPVWADFDGYRVIGLDFGDANASSIDYRTGWLDRYPWRWRRYNVTSAANTSNFSFPANAHGGGGNYGWSIHRHQTQWLGDTTHGSFVG